MSALHANLSPSRTADIVWPLAEHDMLTLHLRAGDRLRCDRGSVWCTVDGEDQDIVLAAGDTYVAPADEVLRASGLKQGRLAVLGRPARPQAPRWPFSALAA
jgi:hypothetical protein